MATIRLKNSVVASKAPAAVDLVLGEVALNANSASPALYFKDNADNIIKLEPGSGVEPSPTPPASPEEGDLWYNETTNSLNYWNGSEWIELGQAGDSPVTSVNGEVGVVVLDAADVGAVAVIGDNMTGNLTLGTDKIVLNAAGSGTFAGILKVDRGTSIPTAQAINVSQGGTQSFEVNNQGDVKIGGSVPGSANIRLNESGSATFVGKVTATTFDLEALPELP